MLFFIDYENGLITLRTYSAALSNAIIIEICICYALLIVFIDELYPREIFIKRYIGYINNVIVHTLTL